MSKRCLVVVMLWSSVLLGPAGARAVEVEGGAGEGAGYWSDWRNVAGWSMLGAGTVALGFWIGSWVRFDEVEAEWESSPDVFNYRMAAGPGGDTCDVAGAAAASDPGAQRVVELCDEGRLWSTVWNVTLPLWVVLWGTAGGLLIWYAVDPPAGDAGGASSGVQLAWSPYVTLTGGGLGLSGWF